jgi:hypothetical protein
MSLCDGFVDYVSPKVAQSILWPLEIRLPQHTVDYWRSVSTEGLTAGHKLITTISFKALALVGETLPHFLKIKHNYILRSPIVHAVCTGNGNLAGVVLECLASLPKHDIELAILVLQFNDAIQQSVIRQSSSQVTSFADSNTEHDIKPTRN